MGIRTVNLEPGSVIRGCALHALMYRPSNTNTTLANESDPSAVSVGDDILNASPNAMPVPMCGVALEYTDAADNDATCTVEITGQNQFGEDVTESLSHTAGGAEFTQSNNAFSSISRIEVTELSNAQAADQLSVGFKVDDAANRIKLGLPAKIRGLNEIVGPYMMQLVAPSGMGNSSGSSLLLENYNSTYYTVDVASASATGIIGMIVLKDDVGIETR